MHISYWIHFLNSQFLSEAEKKFPKDTDLIVACQKGLRWTFTLNGWISDTQLGSEEVTVVVSTVFGMSL